MDDLMITNEIKDMPKRFLQASTLISKKDPKFIMYWFLPWPVEGIRLKNMRKIKS